MATRAPTLRIVFIGLLSLAIAMGIGRFAFTPLLPLMRDDELISIADGGVLASVHFMGYWLGAVFAARLPLAPKTTLRVSLFAIALATFGMGLTADFFAWLALRWISGACSAFILVIVSNFYVKRLAAIGRAEMQGWVFSGVGTGIAATGLGVLAILVAEIGSALSWRIFGVVSLIAAAVVSRRLGAEIPGVRIADADGDSPSTPLAWKLIVAYGAAGIGYIIPATYLPVVAREIVQSPLVFGWSWPIFGSAAFLSTLLASRLHARFSNRQIWTASQVVMAAGLVLPVLWSTINVVILSSICVGGTFMIITMAGIKEVHRIAPENDVMRHIAAMTAAFATGQMIGPVFASSIYDLTGSFAHALLVTGAMLIATAATLMYPRQERTLCP